MSHSPSTPIRGEEAKGIKTVAWDITDDDLSLEMPEFHFSWLAEGGRKDRGSTAVMHTPGSDVGTVPSAILSSVSSAHTPPIASATSSASSDRKLSTSSAASSYPTPPGSDYPSNSSRTGRSKMQPSAASVAVEEMGQLPSSTSLASRSYGRVASTPISNLKEDEDLDVGYQTVSPRLVSADMTEDQRGSAHIPHG